MTCLSLHCLFYLSTSNVNLHYQRLTKQMLVLQTTAAEELNPNARHTSQISFWNRVWKTYHFLQWDRKYETLQIMCVVCRGDVAICFNGGELALYLLSLNKPGAFSLVLIVSWAISQVTRWSCKPEGDIGRQRGKKEHLDLQTFNINVVKCR